MQSLGLQEFTEGKIQFRNNHASNDYSNTISTTFFGKLND